MREVMPGFTSGIQPEGYFILLKLKQGHTNEAAFLTLK